MSVFGILLFTIALVVAISLIYSTVKLGISPMPSSSKAYGSMRALVKGTGTGTIIDLGSGWGNFVISIAKQMPERQVIGYELSLFPWLISKIVKNALGLHNLTLYRKNFYHEKLPDASVIVCYLYPQAMSKIKRKLLTEQPDVDFLISNNFALPFAQADKIIQLNDFYRSPVYLYQVSKLTI